jgi:hypothetical protein
MDSKTNLREQSMMRRTIFLALSLMAPLSAANAEWTAKVEGPDVFGNTKVLATTDGFRESIVVQCDQKDEMFIAYVFRKKEFDSVTSTTADFLVQTDGGQPTKLNASLRNWNDNFAGVVASGKSAEIISVIKAIASARGKIGVGVVVRGNQISASFGSSGSRAAMDKVLKNCRLDDSEKKS